MAKDKNMDKITDPRNPTVISLDVRVEHLRDAFGIGMDRPRLSWIIKTDHQDWHQSGYEIETYDSDGQLDDQTGRVESHQSVLVSWPFAPLSSRQQVSLRIRVWDMNAQPSAWSELISIEAGLLLPKDWTAHFVTPDWKDGLGEVQPSPFVRREFELRAGIKSARLYITALGLHEALLNGKVIGDHVFSPGWTVYDQRLRYHTFDVTEMLNVGQNAIGVILGDGWFRGRIGFASGQQNIYGQHLALLAQLEVQYTDGSSETIVTDDTYEWRAATGPILMNSIYDGETYDARLEHSGWSSPGFDDSNWGRVRNLEWDLNTLEAPIGPPVRRIEQVTPVSITKSPTGKMIVDFGQNLVGRLSIKVKGTAGHTVTLRHAEVMENGELGTRPLRFAKATDRYTLRGGERETWEPRFTFHGFRYVEVNDWPGDLTLQDLIAIVLHTDLERTGWFETSDALLNQLHENVIWGMRGNFLDVPTDCPQRDERLGWTGDLQVFSPTASFLYDVNGFLQSWLKDLAVEQRKAGGIVPPIIPNVMLGNAFGAAAWSDAATIVPWVLYQRFGDIGILSDQFESMRNWVDYVASVAGERLLWDTGFQFGDWLDPTAPPEEPGRARADKALVASAYFVQSAKLVAWVAGVLGHTDEQKKYHALAAAAQAAFAREYITPSGRLMSDAETAYALALVFELFPSAEQRQHAGNRLNELVRESGYHIRTGFVGTPLICDALCNTGHHAAAYRLLMQQECPSWLYPVTMGATTVWERWDSMLPDGSINPGEMTSFNHYALGSVADWMHRTIGGLNPIEPGYRRMEIRPRPGGGISHAKVRHRTPYGMVECSWKIEDGKFYLDAMIPPNTTALITLPGKNNSPTEVGSGKFHSWSVYEDPDLRGQLTVDDLTGDIMSNAIAREAIVNVLVAVGTPEYLITNVVNERNSSLRQSLQMLSNYEDAVEKITKALVAI
jgi:alpha-L-rhamnosidase